MKILIEVTLPYENEIQFFDACKGIIGKLEELAEGAIRDGKCEEYIGHTFDVVAANDDAEDIGTIRVVV